MSEEAAWRAISEESQRAAAEAERQINKIKLAELPGMTDDELRTAYKDEEHDDDRRHTEDCWRCAARALLAQREAERTYTVLGQLPGPQRSYRSVDIVDLEENTHYLAFGLPGTGDWASFYVRVTKVERMNADLMMVTVKICNGEQEWTFPYDSNESLRVIELQAETN